MKSNLRNAGRLLHWVDATNLERIDRKFGGGGGGAVSKITLKSWCYRFRNRFSWQCNGKQDRERRIIAARIIRWRESRNWRNAYISWRASKLTDSERNYFNGRRWWSVHRSTYIPAKQPSYPPKPVKLAIGLLTTYPPNHHSLLRPYVISYALIWNSVSNNWATDFGEDSISGDSILVGLENWRIFFSYRLKEIFNITRRVI